MKNNNNEMIWRAERRASTIAASPPYRGPDGGIRSPPGVTLTQVLEFTDSTGDAIAFSMRDGVVREYRVNGALRMDSSITVKLVGKYEIKVEGSLRGTPARSSKIPAVGADAWRLISHWIPAASRADTGRPLTLESGMTMDAILSEWGKKPRRSDEHLAKRFKTAQNPNILRAILEHEGAAESKYFLKRYAKNAESSWETGNPSMPSPAFLADVYDEYLEEVIRERYSDSDYLLQYLCDGNGRQLSDRDRAKVEAYLRARNLL